MQPKTLRRWNNAIHRDLGYFFFGMTIIYALSGIILNHFKSGDFVHPDYSKRYEQLIVALPLNAVPDKAYALKTLEQVHEEKHFKSFVTGRGYVQIFFDNGSLYIDLNNGKAELEEKTPRYVLKEFNLLHYNNIKRWFTWFSDAYAVAMILLAITGLFILRGKNGIKWRGAALALIGIIIPAIIILLYA
ncbi:MAG: PepSY-associated TM helix domain-containing protein [Bacteroidetes bacterium]|nr:PepSY-associated TM helix domain-containing protein [Bacteroidota bacterium]